MQTAFSKFYTQDPNNPFLTVGPRELDVVHVPVRMSTLGTNPKMIVARTMRCYVADESAIVEFDAKTMESNSLLFVDGFFTGKIYKEVLHMAQEQAAILIDAGICHPSLIRAFQSPEERTLTVTVQGEEV